MAIDKKTEEVLKLMKIPEVIRNIGICAHIDHGKTTLSDNLLSGAGMISEELAGKQCAMDFLQEEQERGITIQTANISMVHTVEGKQYLINLLDTPGHVDFGGDVTRAMRAVDGAIVVACAVEGVMPQTETVLRQALKERVKPVLFINKVDRLISEVKLTPEKMQERFIKIINDVNKIIVSVAPPEFKDKWTVSVTDGSVAFGSAYHNWGLSVNMMKKKNITFKDVIDAYQNEERDILKKKAPLHEALLDMVVKHLPSPVVSQKYRIPKLWQGDIESLLGQKLINCDSNAPLVFIITKMMVDPQAGEIAFGRIFSGVLKKGQEIHLSRAKMSTRVQQVALSKGAKRIIVDEVPAGNVAQIIGLKAGYSGETVSEEAGIAPFETIKHLFDPVVTKAIEAKNPKDLGKLTEALKQLEKEDPTIKVTINEETGENLIAGLGELHLEIKEHILTRDKGIEIITSSPIVVYREAINKPSEIQMGKSPNKHNKLFVKVEPLPDEIVKAIVAGEIPETKIKKKNLNEIVELLAKYGMDRNEAKSVKDIYKGCIFVDGTSGIVHIQEIIGMVVDAAEEVIDAGPMAGEPCVNLKITIDDAKLHEDSIHRGPGQIIPAMRQAVHNCLLTAGDVLFEPKQTIRIDAPLDYLGAISKLVQARRGQLLDTEQDEHTMVVKAKLPVAEMIGFTSSLRSATEGRGAWFLVDQTYEKLPNELQDQVVMRTRKRKGMKEEIPKPVFAD